MTTGCAFVYFGNVARRRRATRNESQSPAQNPLRGGQGGFQGSGKPPIHLPSQPPEPTHRLLRGYAFDPSLATQLETALVSEITYKVPWDRLTPGPCGEYIEVVDYDPPSDCFYAPVDLDCPEVLAQNGLKPSEGNPQFHQQMVYAAARLTIDKFERALGRRTSWADRSVRFSKSGKSGRSVRRETTASDDEYVERLRIYPHALRTANAYYSRNRGALLFGYFPAIEDRSSGQFPAGMVFTCLSHDIVAHETTHALLDGFHEHFMEATNPDVLAFHEAFADIVALFQHFSFPEVLEHQIAKTKGNLGSENLLGQLATQFGHARGAHGALRDAIGQYDKELKKWVKHTPDSAELDQATEVHARGAILVAAVFDAFLSIYLNRTRDLLRLASGGTGVLQQGELHPDLVARLAREASAAAEHVLTMCIRALDYCPPVDLTFGDFLRALITADMDLVLDDRHSYRVAFIEAFRRRGIYPLDIRTLSEDSLRWPRPGEDPILPPGELTKKLALFIRDIDLRRHVERLRYKKTRKEIWTETRDIRRELHGAIRSAVFKAGILQRLAGLAFTPENIPAGVKVRSGEPVFDVHSLREARRVRDDGRALNQVFLTITQKLTVEGGDRLQTIRCGCTLVLDLDDLSITYVVTKGLFDTERIENIIKFNDSGEANASLSATYFGMSDEPFAALHRVGA